MQVRAPWTKLQVHALVAWQSLGYVHEFTCPNNHDGSRVLWPTQSGWTCQHCDYTQDWAHDYMLDAARHPKNPIDSLKG